MATAPIKSAREAAQVMARMPDERLDLLIQHLRADPKTGPYFKGKTHMQARKWARNYMAANL